MRDIIRPTETGRRALAFIIFFLISVTVCLGQEPPASQKGGPPPATPPAADAARHDAVAPSEQPADSAAAGKSSKGSKGARSAGHGEVSATGVQAKPYEIGPEDVLFLNVLHQTDVSQQLSVRPDGFVSVRFAGEIKAAGLTTQQLTDVVAEKLTTYFNHPEVNIQVLRINSKKYYVSGEVKRPGSYTLSTPRTILEAIIEAGGPADFAKTKKIYLLRGQERIPFNFNDVSKGKHLEQNILLQNGDVIQVP